MFDCLGIDIIDDRLMTFAMFIVYALWSELIGPHSKVMFIECCQIVSQLFGEFVGQCDSYSYGFIDDVCLQNFYA